MNYKSKKYLPLLLQRFSSPSSLPIRRPIYTHTTVHIHTYDGGLIGKVNEKTTSIQVESYLFFKITSFLFRHAMFKWHYTLFIERFVRFFKIAIHVIDAIAIHSTIIRKFPSSESHFFRFGSRQKSQESKSGKWGGFCSNSNLNSINLAFAIA